MSRPKRRVPVLVTAALAVAATLSISALVIRATFEMFHGHGADTYNNVYGLQIHWVSVLTTVIAVGVALLVALGARLFVIWRDKREIAELIKQLDVRNNTVATEQENERLGDGAGRA